MGLLHPRAFPICDYRDCQQRLDFVDLVGEFDGEWGCRHFRCSGVKLFEVLGLVVRIGSWYEGVPERVCGGFIRVSGGCNLACRRFIVLLSGQPGTSVFKSAEEM